jgi:hypothetical protein
MQRKAYRQGDVLLVELAPEEKISGSPIPADNRRFILAEGEQTGHHHAVAATANVAFLAAGAQRYLRVNKSVELTHQEHEPLDIPPGNYEVRLQRTPAPGSIGVARVSD